jgi:hypothetical protein
LSLTSPRAVVAFVRAVLTDADVWDSLVVMIRRLFTWRMNLYRLMVGAVVLAIVVPASAFEIQQMRLVVVGCILVVIAAVVVGTQVPSTRARLRR